MINKIMKSSLWKREKQRFHDNVFFESMIILSLSFFMGNILFFVLLYLRTDGRGYGEEHAIIFLTSSMLAVWHSMLVLLISGISILSMAISFAPEEKFKIDFKRMLHYILLWIMVISVIEILVTPTTLYNRHNFNLIYTTIFLQSCVLVTVIIKCIKNIWNWMLDDSNQIIENRLKIIQTILLTIIGWFVANNI